MAKHFLRLSRNMPKGDLREFRHDSGEALPFRLVRSARKSLGLFVFRDGSILVRAPNRINLAEIYLFLRERWDWMQQKRTEFADEPAPVPVQYADGARFLHLGQWHVLRLRIAGRAQAGIAGDELVVQLPGGALAMQEDIEAAIRRWQRREAEKLFPVRLAFCHEAMKELHLPFPEMRIRRMRSRWGSCSSRGAITLNLELMRMPLDCIDYVVTHELCHLVEFHHGPAFYALQERFMPDWQARKRLLQELARQQYLLGPVEE
jgi:predicted metal-dependent hydrolase